VAAVQFRGDLDGELHIAPGGRDDVPVGNGAHEVAAQSNERFDLTI
jgi:hypothetical protein